MKKSVFLILVISFVLLLTTVSIGAMSLGATDTIEYSSSANADHVPGSTASQLGAETNDETVNMVFVSVGNPVLAAEAAEDLVTLLEDQTGYSFNAIMADCPGAAVNMMVAGDADFGWLPSAAYVYANELGGAEVKLVAERFGSTYYRGQFVVRKDSGIDTLAGLAENNFAFTEPGSVSGYYYPSMHIINSQELTPDEFFAKTLFAGGHVEVIEAVYNGEFDGVRIDGGATFDDARTLVDHEIADAIEVIEYTEKIPNDTVSVRPGLDSTVVQTVIDGIAAVAGTPEWDTLMQDLYFWDDVAPALDSDYDIVRQ